MIKSRRMRWAGHVARMGEKGNAYRILVGNPEGKRPLGRPRRRWVDNIKLDLREIGWDGRDWIDLAQDRDQWKALVNAVMNLRVPKIAGKFLSGCKTGSFSRRAQVHEGAQLIKHRDCFNFTNSLVYNNVGGANQGDTTKDLSKCIRVASVKRSRVAKGNWKPGSKIPFKKVIIFSVWLDEKN
jgi:hypothetical protein